MKFLKAVSIMAGVLSDMHRHLVVLTIFYAVPMTSLIIAGEMSSLSIEPLGLP